MKKIIFLFLLLGVNTIGNAQYNKEKLSNLLTGGNERSWTVNGINAGSAEKKMIFDKGGSVKVQLINEQIQTMNWSLKTSDEIRWFILIGDKNYELIVSYDKKGNEYIKLTHQSLKGNDNYQIKLTPVK